MRALITGVPARFRARFICEEETLAFMAQLFSPSANVHSRVVIVGIVVLVCGAGWATSTGGNELSQDCNLPFEPTAKLNGV
jgi:hypothetical protein